MKVLLLFWALLFLSDLLHAQIDTVLICDPKDVVQLETTPNRPGYKWSPSISLDNPGIYNPIASPVFNTLYVVEMIGNLVGENLIENPDFENGNVGFESEYPYTDRIFTQGLYGVSVSAKDLNGIYFTDCPDHTSGSGLMMVVDGSPIAGTKVWCQTIDVEPNKQYAFSTWLASVLGANPAELQFSINDEALGLIFTAEERVCDWRQFYQIWNSGDTTSAEICIVNKNTDPDGNDFALDDFLFAETESLTYDSTMVIISELKINASVSEHPDCGENNGRITVDPRGVGNLSFSLDGEEFQNESILNHVGGGFQNVYVKQLTAADSDFNFCISDTTLLVSQNRCPVYVPNSIKRNSTNNHRFRITPHPDFSGELKSLTIYDRWGTLMYEANDHETIQIGWEGKTINQAEVASGIYSYILEINYPDGQTQRIIGDLTVF